MSDKGLTFELDISEITPEYEMYEGDSSKPVSIPEADSVVDMSGYDPNGYDGYILVQVLLPKGEEFKIGTAVKRCVNPTGKFNLNPLPDTCE
jgi:hypothetical protein